MSSESNYSTDLPPKYLVELTAKNVLQLTVSKSSLGLAKTLLESYLRKGGDSGGEGEEGGIEEVDYAAPETFEPLYSIINMVCRARC